MDIKNESKSTRFKRLAEKRTKRVLEDIRILSNLANRGLYEYSPEHVKRISSAVRDALTKAEARFKGEVKDEREFKL